MPLQLSGAISLAHIQGEFGGNSPISLDEYYRGGSLVNASSAANPSAFQTAPLAPASNVQIPSNGAVQFSQFYGAQSVIIGSTGLILAPPENDFANYQGANGIVSDIVDVVLPAGVDWVRLFLVGGGGGGGGSDAQAGGEGGAGMTVSGTVSTAWIGYLNQDRKLRFFVGRGGQGGINKNGPNASFSEKRGGSGFAMKATSWGSWSTWMNTYAINNGDRSNSFIPNAPFPKTLYFPVSGNYQLQFAMDNGGHIMIDGVNVANTNGNNDQGANTDASFSFGSPLTKSVYLTAGFHKVVLLLSNTGNVGGFAARIMDPSGWELWNTRSENSAYTASPTGGAGGYTGPNDTSGYGGAGGAGTSVWLVRPDGSSWPLALAGGGGGGGGGSNYDNPNPLRNGNTFNNGMLISHGAPAVTAGAAGWQNFNNDGGGGGGGGGGVEQAGSGNATTGYGGGGTFSGVGGFPHIGDYGSGDGGQSGRSMISGYASRLADVTHGVTTNNQPALPLNPVGLSPSILYQLNSYGQGGVRAGPDTPQGNPLWWQKGIDGVAYADWGYTNSGSALTPTIVRYPLIGFISTMSDIISYNGQMAGTQWDNSFTGVPVSFTAFGGGGNPGEDYTYYWYNLEGSVALQQTSSKTVIFNIPNISNGRVACIISDQTGASVTESFEWSVVQYVQPDNNTGGGSSCFPMGAAVLMADFTIKAIERIRVGDMVMGIDGPTVVIDMYLPTLGDRKLLTFGDGHTWSEEHTHWTRNAALEQWFWSANPELIKEETATGVVGGLLDNETLRTGEGYEFAHMSGWKANRVTEVAATPALQLYLPITSGSPIIVNGYLVGAGINEAGYGDYSTIDWDISRARIDAGTRTALGLTGPSQSPFEDKEPIASDWERPLAPFTGTLLP